MDLKDRSETLTLENFPSAYLKSRAQLMETDRSILLRDGGISDPTTKSSPLLSCILCLDCIGDWKALQHHLVKSHEVKTEALHAFMSLAEFNGKEVLLHAEQLGDGEHRERSSSAMGEEDHLKLTPSSSTDYESGSLVINLGSNEESTEQSKEIESTEANSLCDGIERFVEGDEEGGRMCCSICSVTFPDRDFLFKHQDDTGHLGVRTTSTGPCYVCWQAKCDQAFSTPALLRHHFASAHAASRSDPPESTDGGQFLCRQCNRAFERKDEFRLHCNCHSMERATECCSCGLRFNSILQFQKHKQMVHNEELNSEQQELYEASLAAASSLALLGASGLKHMTNRASRTSNLTGAIEKDAQSSENGLVTEVILEKSEAKGRVDSKLDENSNSCCQSKLVGVKASNRFAGDILQQRSSESVNLNHSGLLHNICHSSKVGLKKTNGLPESDQLEKHKRKRSRPAKVISDLSKQETINDVCATLSSEYGSRGTSILDLTASPGNTNPLTMSVASFSKLSPLVNSALTSSTSMMPSSGCSPLALKPVDRPFRCSLCKVSYTQRTQLDSHLAAQQHLSRCAKLSEPSKNQHTSTNTQMVLPFAGNHTDQINQLAEYMRQQQKVPASSFLPFGVPFVNSCVAPLLTNSGTPSVASPDVVLTARQVSAAGKEPNHQKVELKPAPVLNIDSASTLVPCDDVAEKTEFSCGRCCEIFPTVERLTHHQGETECMEAARNILAPDLDNSEHHQTMMESILQLIGYECVKQFKSKHSSKRISNIEFSKEKVDDSKSISKERVTRTAEELENEQNNEDCSRASPENVGKYLCWICSKSFSSSFVLKVHQEQVHRQIIPIDVIEKLHNEPEVNYETNCKEEDFERSDTSGGKRRQETTSAMRQSIIKEEIKLKQQQQLQLAAAIQNMQMNIMMSMGMLPQVFPCLPGSVPPELFMPQPFPIMDTRLRMQLQQQQQQRRKSASSATLPMDSPTHRSSAAAANQKSARTRITEQQLLVLRSNFDINNSPTEEQIQEMSVKTGLAMKVIKHWFRNTLFKERQRNKDSPYNFNVPPATTLSLEDFERAPVVSIFKKMLSSSNDNIAAASNSNCDQRFEPHSDSTSTELTAKSEMTNDSMITNRESASHSKMPLSADGRVTSAQSLSQSATDFDLTDRLETQHGIDLNAVVMNNLCSLSPAISTQERRTGRTRFSNQQNQVLQEFFDRNPYPKDDEVEALSRALNLRVRVIVVWFQNARQRIRKTEGHSSLADGSKPAQIDLLQHQLTEHSLSKDSSSNEVSVDDEEQGSRSSLDNEPNCDDRDPQSIGGAKLESDNSGATFKFADQLYEHRSETHSHSVGIVRRPLDCCQKLLPESSQKMSEDGVNFRQSSDDEDQRTDRRMRTTLAQDQLDYLYQKFAVESNPSRSALEVTAAHLNLKPRVVQVWFQNTRARERRGHLRANSQKSLVECSCCSSMFSGKIALDAHVAQQHPVDLVRSIPRILPSGMESVIPPFLALNPMVNAVGMSALQANMQYMYEKSFQQYMSKLANLHATALMPSSPSSSIQSNQSAPTTKTPKPSAGNSDEGPLDLTVSGVTSLNGQLKTEPADVSHTPIFSPNLDDSFSETYSENDEYGLGVDSMSPSAICAHLSHNSSMVGAGKRSRTQMSSLQIRVMRAIFSSYKTPSLAECEILGSQVGLGKRVVQVWFQNSRAKEKKSSVPGQERPDGNDAGSGGLFPHLGNPPTTECHLCNTAYNISHTLQDHLFTKMHIDRVKTAVNSSEYAKSFPNTAFGESGSFNRRIIPSANLLLPIKSVTNLPTMILTKTIESSGNMHGISNNHSENTPILSSNLQQFMGVPAEAANFIGAMMPYLCPDGANPPALPGFNPVHLLSQAPNILPDMSNVLFNSAAICGIQLDQLKIPKQAIEQIQDQIKDVSCVAANYSEDCLTSDEVETHLASEELAWLVEKAVHVGYICKKCHLVFPQVDACNAHQLVLCFKDAERIGDSVLKLEQRLYQCSQCKVNCSTVKEFRVHCAHEKHRRKTKNPETGNFTS